MEKPKRKPTTLTEKDVVACLDYNVTIKDSRYPDKTRIGHSEVVNCQNFVYNRCWDDREAWLPGEKELLEIMQSISSKKQEEQIKEVDKKGLWKADLITIELSEFAKAISKRLRGNNE